MADLLHAAYEHAQQALDDSCCNNDDPDLLFRAAWHMERVACHLALLTDRVDVFLQEFPHLSAVVASSLDRLPADDFVDRLYHQARLALDDIYRNESDPDLVFRLTWALGQIGCGLAVLAERQDEFSEAFPGVVWEDEDTAEDWADETEDLGHVSLAFFSPLPSRFEFVRYGQGLGTLGGQTSYAENISGDGRVVVGRSLDVEGRSTAFRWVDGQMHGLGFADSGAGRYSGSFAASADGAVIIGQCNIGRGVTAAFRWCQRRGFECISPDQGKPFYINAVSADGQYTVGNFHTGETYIRYGLEAPRGLGNALNPGMPFFDIADPASNFSNANGISADGSVLSGVAKSARYDMEAFIWSEQTGMVGLGVLPDGTFSQATALAADGWAIVGTSGDRTRQAFRWTASEGMVGLGFLDGASTTAQAVCADGSIVVGCTLAADAAFIWDEVNGMRDLQEVLVAGGLGQGLEGWRLTQAQAISADGSTIAGVGIHPDGHTEAWMVKATWGLAALQMPDTLVFCP